MNSVHFDSKIFPQLLWENFFRTRLHLCNPAGGYIRWGLIPTTDTDLLLATYKGGSHLTSNIVFY